jgi:1-acyl-sn-glycerol-3-phosphate acyltransferase
MTMAAEALNTEAPPARPGMRVDLSSRLTRGFLKIAHGLQRYHRHSIVGLDRLERALDSGRRIILVGNHALSVVDPMLFTSRVFEDLGVVPRFIGHELGWFKTPIARKVSERYRVIPSADPKTTEAALLEDGFLMLFPGGATEAALRDYAREGYQLRWENRLGFLKLALEHDADILFIAAVGSEDAYYQSRLEFPKRFVRYIDKKAGDRYAGARIPLGLLGPVLPLPVKITHVVSEPLDLGNRKRALATPGGMSQLHRRIWTECQAFLDRAVARERAHADLTDRATRKAERALHRLGF